MTLYDAITKRFENQEAERLADEQARRERARADLKLHGTPAWDLLSQARRNAAAIEQLAQHDEALDAAEAARKAERKAAEQADEGEAA